MTNDFQLHDIRRYIAHSDLEEFATPYPESVEGEARQVAEKTHYYRNAFSRDRDRIVHCRSFRKLQNKTQVFVSGLNPSVRNRLTHTIEVWQLSVTMARSLGANIDLTEAIAFGHDLGHTPFGHSGEISLGKQLEKMDFGGFNHNEQSVIVCSFLEESPKKITSSEDSNIGLNLTRASLEGILKHTTRYERGVYDKRLNSFGFNASNGSIEAQIVHIADDIAQKTHDLHDLYNVNIIKDIWIYRILKDYSSFFGEGDESDLIEKFSNDGLTKDMISHLVTRLVDDVLDTSLKNLNDEFTGDPTNKRFINYSSDVGKFVKELENITNTEGINSDEVNQMNARGRNIINSLYALFVKDPYCMPRLYKGKFSNGIKEKVKQEDIRKMEDVEIKEEKDVRVICDYIASLTDNEAIDRFHSLLA